MTTSIARKIAYVKSQDQTRAHHCHWPGCSKQVPPAKWGCFEHWKKLPKRIRDRIWAAYQPGQEKTLTPSAEYLAAAREAKAWVLANHPPATTPQSNLFA